MSVIVSPRGSGYRVVMNRDERNDRPQAHPPTIHIAGPTGSPMPALWPTDQQAGGTWIAINAKGLTFALMNKTGRDDSLSTPDPNHPPRSRGLIIPSLAHTRDLDEAMALARSHPWELFRPCRLALFAREGSKLHGALHAWNGRDLMVEQVEVESLCLASSGMGDDLVQTRVPLFQEVVSSPSPADQDAFHLHRWPDSPHTSVFMSRPAHRTVSITTIDVDDARASVTYRAVGPDLAIGQPALGVLALTR